MRHPLLIALRGENADEDGVEPVVHLLGDVGPKLLEGVVDSSEVLHVEQPGRLLEFAEAGEVL